MKISMKTNNLLCMGMVLLCLAACKKDNAVIEPEDQLELLKDSASYSINGSRYNALAIEKNMTFTTQSNLRITSGPTFNYLLQGDKDSTLFVREYSIKASFTNIAVSFIKIYNNNQTEFTNENNGGSLNYPQDKTDIFSPGIYRYSTEFMRSNSTPGIAFTVINRDGIFTSYSQSDLGKPASVTQADQNGSKFEIISLKKRKSDYLLEARFSVNTFGENKKSLRLENGYLRMSVLKQNQ